ncbi:MAG: ankyrin repeat domain-containing protein, partial [Firmicutes bacterium]|nr:ankyrin repeat domain-containing protein [Bacillota bacterium]
MNKNNAKTKPADRFARFVLLVFISVIIGLFFNFCITNWLLRSHASRPTSKPTGDTSTDRHISFRTVRIGDVRRIASFIKNGISLNMLDVRGEAPLIAATSSIDAVRVLLGAGAEIKNVDTGLIEASQTGHNNIVKILLKSGTDPNIKDSYGNTALILASQYGHKNIVKMLLESGADPNIQSKDGITALIFASEYGHKNIVEMLLKSGAGPNLKSSNGETALSIANKKGYTEIAAILKKAGGLPSESFSGQTDTKDFFEAAANGD